MEINVGKNDVIWSLLGTFFQYCTNLIILPFILNSISTQELGLWYSFASIGTLVTYLDFGFSTTLLRNITYAWSGANRIRKRGFVATDVKDKINVPFVKQMLFTCKIVCFVVAVIALIVMAFAGTTYILYVTRNFFNQQNALIAWTIYALAVFLNIYYNYCANALKGIGLIGAYQKILVFSRTSQIILSYLGIKLGFGLIALSSSYLVSGFMIRLLSKIFLSKEIRRVEIEYGNQDEKLSNLKRRIDDSIGIFKDIWYNAKRSGLIALCSYATNQSLTLICSAYLGVEETAPYGLCLQLISAIMSVAGLFMSIYQPKLINSMALNRDSEYRKLFSMCMFIFASVSCAGIAVVSCLLNWILSVLGSNTVIPVGMFIFMGTYMFLEHNHGQYTAYFTMRNEIVYLKAYIISSLGIVLGSWILAIRGKNIYMLMAVHFVVQICFNNWYWPYKAMKLMNTNPVKTMIEGAKESFHLLRNAFKTMSQGD